MVSNNTYECVVCHGINSVKKLHCSTCGTIPAMYSIVQGVTTIEKQDSYYIEILSAFGVERQRSRRTIKRVMRTVPLDYYADATASQDNG